MNLNAPVLLSTVYLCSLPPNRTRGLMTAISSAVFVLKILKEL